jgi:hypothetical protein
MPSIGRFDLKSQTIATVFSELLQLLRIYYLEIKKKGILEEPFLSAYWLELISFSFLFLSKVLKKMKDLWFFF